MAPHMSGARLKLFGMSFSRFSIFRAAGWLLLKSLSKNWAVLRGLSTFFGEVSFLLSIKALVETLLRLCKLGVGK